MRTLFITACCALNFICFAQIKPSNFGYRHFTIEFEKDTVHILVKSKKEERLKKKPVFFEIQGSTAVPLIVHNGQQQVSYVSLTEGLVENDYHLVMVNKPGLPLMIHNDSLTKGKYKDPNTKQYPQNYLKNNNLHYYVERNNKVIEFLKKQDWVDSTKVVVAGHSEGSSIAAHMADKIEGITHLIYSGGTPYYPRILTMIQQDRKQELKKDNDWVKKDFDYWKDIVKYPLALDKNKGWNTNYGTYSFSENENDILKRLKIPILISYGTMDEGAPFCDMFQLETIKERSRNFTFYAYVGLNHYYQSELLEDASKQDYLTKVINDWLQWLKDY